MMKNYPSLYMTMEKTRKSASDNLTDTDAPTQIEILQDKSPDYQQDYNGQT